jgi:hypothetical protein
MILEITSAEAKEVLRVLHLHRVQEMQHIKQNDSSPSSLCIEGLSRVIAVIERMEERL